MKRVLASLGLVLWSTGLLAQSGPNEFDLELLQPTGSRAWTAGTVERLEIALDPEQARIRGVHEWEAFLSLDGGKHFSIRLTPHLDLDRLVTTFVVPEVATDDARLMLRVGDEEREHEIEVATRFRIEPARAVPRTLVGSRPVPHGESARVGELGVSEWVEGVGAAQRRVVAAAPLRSMRSDSRWSVLRNLEPFLPPEPRPLIYAATLDRWVGFDQEPSDRIAAHALAPLTNAVSLTRISRRNE